MLQIGPHPFQTPLNTVLYHRFLIHRLWPLCRDAGIQQITFADIMWFQQDGAPAHTSGTCIRYLQGKFRGRFISKRGNVNWPPRSPDLNPLDFFLWGHIKTIVYKSRIENEQQLQDEISQAFRSIEPNMCGRSTDNLLKRARACIAQNGGHFEHLLHY